ncbi:SDR family oxidoreductase [Candidatus Sumerlaeota bacterium]|nr:SDR family oxidoreductase [Candidatus Sumerlaeota bacterium]
MDLGLRDRAAVVFAASRGLGRAAALELAREGARVLIASRDEKNLRSAADAIADESGTEVITQICDVARAEDVRAVFDHATEELGGVDVLVNNTGGPRPGDFGDLSEEDWRTGHEVTLLSAARAIRHALPLMRRAGGGRIVNLTSFTVRQPAPGLLLSNVYRAGLVALAKTLAAELAPEGILINTVGPGFIDTDRVRELTEIRAAKQGKTTDEIRAGIAAQIPLGRIGQPAELGRLVAWLGSWANTYLTGQVLILDGGLVRAI